MKVAVVGSRQLQMNDIEKYLPRATTEIISGGAKGIDQSAKACAEANGFSYTEFRPDYRRYGKGAPLKRNIEIINYAEYVIVFWDGKSRGTKFVIEYCEKNHRPITVHQISKK